MSSVLDWGTSLVNIITVVIVVVAHVDSATDLELTDPRFDSQLPRWLYRHNHVLEQGTVIRRLSITITQ